MAGGRNHSHEYRSFDVVDNWYSGPKAVQLPHPPPDGEAEFLVPTEAEAIRRFWANAATFLESLPPHARNPSVRLFDGFSLLLPPLRGIEFRLCNSVGQWKCVYIDKTLDALGHLIRHPDYHIPRVTVPVQDDVGEVLVFEDIDDVGDVCVSRSTPGVARCTRSPSPVSVTG